MSRLQSYVAKFLRFVVLTLKIGVLSLPKMLRRLRAAVYMYMWSSYHVEIQDMYMSLSSHVSKSVISLNYQW